eukprot:TRINITY_DN37135_c0_g1_i1.p1 TRINITY_DN37135_c0_g1~~TRINITY_DN37135_c0_g1_i1.p1  ORF type:complete len:463 (+),score=59.21 TRINITY_DN37135_c0_g1_i1:124-1512(+)
MLKRCCLLQFFPPGSPHLTNTQRLLTKNGYKGPVTSVTDKLDWTDNETVQYLDLVCVVYKKTILSRRDNASGRLTSLLQNLRDRGCHIGTYTSSKAISLYTNYGNIEAAERLFETVSRESGRDSSYVLSAMLSAYSSVGKLTSFRYVLELIRKSGNPPTIHVFNSTLRCLSYSRNERAAVRTLEALAKTDILPDENTVRSFMRCCSGYHSGKKVIQSIKNGNWGANVSKVNLEIYNSWIKTCSREKNMHNAFGILEDMKKDKIQPDVSTYNSLAMVARDTGEMGNLKKVLDMMEAANIEPEYVVYLCIIEVILKQLDTCPKMKYAHWVKLAEATFGEAESKGLLISIELFTSLARCYEKTNCLEKIVTLRQRLHKHGFPDYDEFIKIYADCLQRQTNCSSVWVPFDHNLPAVQITGGTLRLPPMPCYQHRVSTEPDWFSALNKGNYLLGGLDSVIAQESSNM